MIQIVVFVDLRFALRPVGSGTRPPERETRRCWRHSINAAIAEEKFMSKQFAISQVTLVRRSQRTWSCLSWYPISLHSTQIIVNHFSPLSVFSLTPYGGLSSFQGSSLSLSSAPLPEHNWQVAKFFLGPNLTRFNYGCLSPLSTFHFPPSQL